MTAGAPRRLALRRLAWPALAALAGPGCAPPPGPPLRIGAQAWLGYELMFRARQRGYFGADEVRLVEVPTASASLRALSAGTLEGAGLTLDEVISARVRGLPLRVVAVLDMSNGADMLLGAPDLPSLAALRGRRIGVEQSATGALMLDAALMRVGLGAGDVHLVPLAFSEHAQALLDGRVDALVTFEPASSRLRRRGAKLLFSSAEVPGLIVDVLALHADALAARPGAVRALVAGALRARDDWLQSPAALAPLLAPRLRLAPPDVLQAFAGVELPDLPANRRWLGGPDPALLHHAARLAAVMQRASLLPPGGASLPGGTDLVLADPRFLPAG